MKKMTRLQQEKQVKECVEWIEDNKYCSYGYSDYIDGEFWRKKRKVDIEMEKWLRGRLYK